MSDDIKKLLIKMDERITKMDERMDRQEQMMQQLVSMVGKNNEGFTEMTKRFDKVDGRLERIENAVNRIEQNEPADVIGMLDQMNKKLDERDYDLQALNKRVFKTESEIERLTQQ